MLHHPAWVLFLEIGMKTDFQCHFARVCNDRVVGNIAHPQRRAPRTVQAGLKTGAPGIYSARSISSASCSFSFGSTEVSRGKRRPSSMM